MPPDLDASALPDLRRRLSTLRADTPARWGRMDASAMLRHLRASIGMSLGEVEVPRLVPNWIGAPVGWLFTHVLTRWPRSLGGRNPPVASLHPEPARESFEELRTALVSALATFVEARRAEPQRHTLHPVFGDLTLERWGRVHALHLEHHLRQFGC